MTKPKSKSGEMELIHPDYFYNFTSPVTRWAIGYGPTTTAEKIKSGELPPPVKLSPSGRSSGWYGFQLIKLRQDRIAAAEAAAAERRAKQQAAPAKPRARSNKVA